MFALNVSRLARCRPGLSVFTALRGGVLAGNVQCRGFALSRSDRHTRNLWQELIEIGEYGQANVLEQLKKRGNGVTPSSDELAKFSYPKVLYPHHSNVANEITFFLGTGVQLTVIEPPVKGMQLLDFDNTHPSEIYVQDFANIRVWHYPALEIHSVPYALYRGAPESFDVVFDRACLKTPAVFSGHGRPKEVPWTVTTMMGHALKVGGVAYVEMPCAKVWDYVKWNKHALDDWLAKQSDDFRYKHFFKPMLRKYKPTNKRVRGMAYVIQEMTKVYSVDSFTLVSCELVTRKKFVRKATPVVLEDDRVFVDLVLGFKCVFIKKRSTMSAYMLSGMHRKAQQRVLDRMAKRKGNAQTLEDYVYHGDEVM